MYHARFNGTHYEIGYRWGNRLKQNGKEILTNVPFPITEERLDFGEKSEPFYREFFPEILDEIRGIADGQSCSYPQLIAVLFSMYCIIPSINANCSCFAARIDQNGVILGRNSDFLTEIENLYMNTIYKFTSDSYSFTGNTTAFVEIEDGINEHGLAIGLTSVAPDAVKPGLNAALLLRLFLEKCKNVNEVILLIENLPIASAQTFIAADALGDAALIECSSQEVAIQKVDDQTSFVCATNMFNLDQMKGYQNLPTDSWFAEERYQTLLRFLSSNVKTMDLHLAQQLLAGEEGFLCQYDRKTGKDTVWSVVYQMADQTIFRVEGNPSRKPFKEDKRHLQGRGRFQSAMARKEDDGLVR